MCDSEKKKTNQPRGKKRIGNSGADFAGVKHPIIVTNPKILIRKLQVDGQESISPRPPMKRLKGQCGSFLQTHNWHYNIILG